MRPVGVKLFHDDGRTDMTNLTVAFRSCANAPKNKLVEICDYKVVNVV
jgi:hypothetical protein